MPEPTLPATDRPQIRQHALERLQRLLDEISDLNGLPRLEHVGRETTQALEHAKTARKAAYDAALSASFYAGAKKLHEVLATDDRNWLQMRRRVLKVQTTPFLSGATPEQIAERARELGIAEVPNALQHLPQLARDHVKAEEWARAVRDVRDELVRSLYSASVLNPDGITQPMLARAGGLSEQRVWQLLNPDFRANRPRHGNRPLYPPKDQS